jgi:predicted TIM-barrel fold metal-dependent hydrolase
MRKALQKPINEVASLFQAAMVKNEGFPDVFGDLRHLYYDVAGPCVPKLLGALRQTVAVDHLLYGSDYPHTPEVGCYMMAEALKKTDLLTDTERQLVYKGNARQLLPRLK